MTMRRFRWLLHARGASPAAWPAAEREAALALLRADGAAREALADLLASEEVSAKHDPADADALGRMGAVVSGALRPARPLLRGLRWGALAACVAAGLWLGVPAASDGEAAGLVASSLASDSPAMVLAALE